MRSAAVAVAIGLALAGCELDRTAGPFRLEMVPGEYLAEIELVGVVDCPEEAPILLPDQKPISLDLEEGTRMVVEDLVPVPLEGPVAPDGSFEVRGVHPSAIGEVDAAMRGEFLDPIDGRGFVALLVERASGCRQEYRVRAF